MVCLNKVKDMETSETVKQIKRSFRLFMNGVTASSMRQKGLDYKVNWGVSQVDLRRMAQTYGKDKALAEALWTENTRECKLLATLVMPSAEMTCDEAVAWAESAPSVETAEAVVFNLFQHLDFAAQLAGTMLASERQMTRLEAYNLVCRLLKRGSKPDGILWTQLFESAAADLSSADRQLLHALVNCLDYIAATDDEHAKSANKLLIDAGFEAF